MWKYLVMYIDDYVCGEYGYDNVDLCMQVLFVVYGLVFWCGVGYVVFFNVDVYLLMVYLLGIMFVVNDGNYDVVKDMLVFVVC